jgi:hypothetical protein
LAQSGFYCEPARTSTLRIQLQAFGLRQELNIIAVKSNRLPAGFDEILAQSCRAAAFLERGITRRHAVPHFHFGGWFADARAERLCLSDILVGRFGRFILRQIEAVVEESQKVTVSCEPTIAERFGRRLQTLGWIRDDAWTPYCFSARAKAVVMKCAATNRTLALKRFAGPGLAGTHHKTVAY